MVPVMETYTAPCMPHRQRYTLVLTCLSDTLVSPSTDLLKAQRRAAGAARHLVRRSVPPPVAHQLEPVGGVAHTACQPGGRRRHAGDLRADVWHHGQRMQLRSCSGSRPVVLAQVSDHALPLLPVSHVQAAFLFLASVQGDVTPGSVVNRPQASRSKRIVREVLCTISCA